MIAAFSLGSCKEHIVTFHDDGSIHESGWERKGLRTGTWTFYRPDGRIYEQGEYKNGLRTGRWEFYTHATASCLTYSIGYKNNVEKGERVDYYCDSRSVWKQYEGLDNSGRVVGAFKEYYRSGNLKTTGEYGTGCMCRIDSSGKVVFEILQDSISVRVGIWQEFADTLTNPLRAEGQYYPCMYKVQTDFVDTISGQQVTFQNVDFLSPKDGVWQYWDKDGNLTKEEIYVEGELIDTKEHP